MQTRRIGPFDVSATGLGCMKLSHAYAMPPPPAEAERLLGRALDLGCTLFDIAALYGFGANETLVGRALRARRKEFVLASKFGVTGVDRKRAIDGGPQTLKRPCEESLRQLNTDVIYLYYLHRWGKLVPIADSVGSLAGFVRARKIRAIGLSEVSGEPLRRAHRVHPIGAVQSEYSLWTRNPEAAVLDACRELGAGFVALSPLARGLLADAVHDPDAFAKRGIRRGMPRVQSSVFAANLRLLDGFRALAREDSCSPANPALASMLAQGEHVVAIPGTTRLDHLEDNLAAAAVALGPAMLERLEAQINARTVSGPRYSQSVQAEIDTEEIPT